MIVENFPRLMIKYKLKGKMISEHRLQREL